MLYNDTLTEAFNMGFQMRLKKSEQDRQKLYDDMSCYYYNDYERISEILREYTLNNPYSAETQRTLRFRHIDVIQKVCRLLCAGIFTQRPIVTLLDGSGEAVDVPNLDFMLKQTNFFAKIKDAFQKSQFFNLIASMPVWNFSNSSMRIDNICPNDFAVATQPEDYLQLAGIKIRKAYGNEVYYTYWTDSEHYYTDEDNNTKEAIEGNPSMVNPFGKIPVSILRLKEGTDFWGEPNYNLYLYQINSDITLTEIQQAEQRVTHQIWLGINTGLSQGDQLKPGMLINQEVKNPDEVQPSLESITSNYDFDSLRTNDEWFYKRLAQSQGISSSNVSTEVNDLSGIAKLIDNQELEETRQDFKEALYNYSIDLLNNCRMVWNAYSSNTISEDLQFEFTFTEDPQSETISDRVARREMERAYFIANEVDFVMQDLELDEQAAIEHIQRKKEQNEMLSLSQPVNDVSSE